MPDQKTSLLPQALELFLGSLGPSFYMVKPSDRGVAFGIAEKARPNYWWVGNQQVQGVHDGTRISPPPGGGKMKVYGFVSYAQSRIIENTSVSVSEMVDRFKKHIFDGIDTTRSYERPTVSAADIEAVVNQRVKEELDKRIDELVQRRLKETTEDDVPTGLRERKRPKRKEASKAIDDTMELWKQRAASMGISPPIQRKRDRHIDGRWLRRAEALWTQFKEGEDVSGQDITLPETVANS